MLKKAFLLFHTIRYLKFIQIFSRVKQKLVLPKFEFLAALKVANIINTLKPIVKKQRKMFGINSFIFLNKEFSVKVADDWNSSSQDKLWLYNLHYFDDLNAVDSSDRSAWHNDLFQKWIKENPPGYGNGWEPYPSSLRIVNWIKWFLLNNKVEKKWLDSLTNQVGFLSQNLEYHILGNHLFANAKALIFAGLYLEGVRADKWYQLGVEILNKELPEQVLADGGNFELSPMYHAIFLEDLLDIINIHQVYERRLPSNIASKVMQMIEWLKAMCHPDGEISFFNDSALGIAPTLRDLLDYSKRLNIVYNDSQISQLTHLEDSGYIRVNKDNFSLIADVADIGPNYIPGHGHADVLSFELSLFGERVIVNSGISTYKPGDDRNMQRSTSYHSTVSIDSENSSEVWGGFRVAKRAKAFKLKTFQETDKIEFSACHDGYKRLNGKIVHCRKWNVSDGFLEVSDFITGNSKHLVSSVLPLHPNVVVSKVQNDSIDLKIKGKMVKISFKGKGSLLVKESCYHPEFGLSIRNKQLIYNYNGSLPFKTIIKISW